MKCSGPGGGGMTTETVSEVFTLQAVRFSHSWLWARPAFRESLRRIKADGAWRPDSGHEVLWRTRHKYTLKIPLADKQGAVAFKCYPAMRLFPYLYYTSPTTREADNYCRLEALGLPMARVLAVGSERFCFLPRSCFIVTEFAEGFRDGCVFFPGAELEAKHEWRDEFCRRNFALVAKLHDIGFYHRGFTPGNVLWRARETPDGEGNALELRWIDVATCHAERGERLRRRIAEDLAHFLRPWEFSPERHRELLKIYLGAAQVRRFELEELFVMVEAALAKRLAKKRKKHFRK